MSSFAPQPSSLVPGYKLDRYELLCPIAEGGMASVWVARLQGKHGFEKLVAVKTILPRYASDMRFQHMFLDEARIASRIEHTNVAQILDLGEESNTLYLVMEWVDGDAVSKLARAVEEKGEKIPHGIVLRILADICGGLHVAHELRGSDGALLGVVHRDVSPQNVLVSTRGVAKLIDFGIAKARDRVVGDTNTGFLKGKILYMAPEQAMGHAVDRRADVWAVGSILYHLLAGKPPFEGANQLATLHLLTLGRPPVPISGVHPAVQAVVRRALTHDPAKRFATALDMQTAIESAMVEAKITTTTADVAAFCAEHLAERAMTRKVAVEGSLKAARERSRNAQLLGAAPYDSASGTSPPVSGKEALLTMPAVPHARSSPGSESGLRGPITESSSATLGAAAALASPVRQVGVRKRTWAVAIAAGVVTLGVAALVATVAVRGGRDVRVDGAKPPLPPASIAAPPPETSAVVALVPEGGAVTPAVPASSIAVKPKMPVGGATPWAPPPTPTTKATQPPKRKVDPDGF